MLLDSILYITILSCLGFSVKWSAVTYAVSRLGMFFSAVP